jgi:sulfur carrier protein ThiS
MRIRVKLMGVLKEKSPPGGELEIAEGTSVGDVLRKLDITTHQVHVCTVNGQFVKDHGLQLRDADELTVFPPVGGG